MLKQAKVAVQDCFVPAGRLVTGGTTAIVWIVVDLFEGRDGIAYARLANRSDRSSIKTIATHALLDRNLFRQADG